MLLAFSVIFFDSRSDCLNISHQMAFFIYCLLKKGPAISDILKQIFKQNTTTKLPTYKVLNTYSSLYFNLYVRNMRLHKQVHIQK